MSDKKELPDWAGEPLTASDLKKENEDQVEDVFSEMKDYAQSLREEFGIAEDEKLDSVTQADRLLNAALPSAIATLAQMSKHASKDADRIKASKIIADYHYLYRGKTDDDKLGELVRALNVSEAS